MYQHYLCFLLLLIIASTCCLCRRRLFVDCLSFTSKSGPTRIALVGGTGQIGKAIAQHLLLKCPYSDSVELTLIGRSYAKAKQAVQELKVLYPKASVHTLLVKDVWSFDDDTNFLKCLYQSHIIIHTAGPYTGKSPVVLQKLLNNDNKDCCCRVYVDVSDPLDYLYEATSQKCFEQAQQKGITAVVAAGAFPGMSNVLAMEAAAAATKTGQQVKDLYFQYFTAGLGGSGVVNLYITNLGFGDDMVQYNNGKIRRYTDLSGRLLGTVDFESSLSASASTTPLGKVVKRVGIQQVFSWPFPEAATVAKQLNITGNSFAAMGTAPDIWNTLLGILVEIIPRSWWRISKFSQFLADFSQPLVAISDQYLKLIGIGETHAMRIDVIMGKSDDNSKDGNSFSIIQAHESFQQCVGQSCAEFAFDCFEYAKPGVYLPEQRYEDSGSRQRIINKLTTTPGTLCYTGPVHQEYIEGPTELRKVLGLADMAEKKKRKV